MKSSSGAAESRIRHWWQAYPMTGLVLGWIVIGLVGWRLWTALAPHHG